MSKRRGRKSAAQTPAPKAEQIKGSKKNPKGTAASELSAARIKLSSDTMGTLKKKLDEFKEKHPKKKNVTLNDLKAVYRRGSGAYSSSHRPTITGGRPNSRAAWSYARVNKFLEKAAGKKVKVAYVQDDDLLENGGNIGEVDYIIKNDSDKYYSRNLATGGVKWNDSQDMAYMLKKNEAEDIVTKLESEGYKNLIIDKYDKEWWKKMEEGGEIFERGGKTKGKGDCYQAAGDFAIGKYFAPKIDFRGEPYIVHAEVTGQGSIEGLRYGHAWVEDDVFIYDYSNNREIVFPKELYYRIGEVNTKDPKKYRRYTFAEARKKMLDTGNYGSWDIETEYADGGLMTEGGYKVYVNDEYRRTITDENLKEYYLTKGFEMNDGKLQIYGQDISFEDGGELGEQITCVKCDWSWSTADSDESDKYVCHKCGFDNSLFYDTDILKPNLTVQQIAEKHNVEVDYVLDQLIKGAEHELEHTNDELELTQRNNFAKRIALHHIAETPDYYEKLDKLNLEEGAEIEEIILEDNSLAEDISQLEVDIAEYLMQQNAEAQDVMYCTDSRVFKTMICKTKIEIAQNRLENTENPEEQNCWNECILIWTDCLDNIVENNIPVREYKDGGSPCGCSKMYEKGGLAYGNSHDKGGMPLEVSSTGQKIEIEGGEGVVNKRSMQSTKKVDFEGRKLTPCEVVSKINEMGGGVKFKCSDVKEIIAEDGHF